MQIGGEREYKNYITVFMVLLWECHPYLLERLEDALYLYLCKLYEGVTIYYWHIFRNILELQTEVVLPSAHLGDSTYALRIETLQPLLDLILKVDFKAFFKKYTWKQYFNAICLIKVLSRIISRIYNRLLTSQ